MSYAEFVEKMLKNLEIEESAIRGRMQTLDGPDRIVKYMQLQHQLVENLNKQLEVRCKYCEIMFA